MAEIFFWVSVLGIGFAYSGYGALLWALSKFRARGSMKDKSSLPSVTFIIAAHNEERSIEGKLRNVLGLDYPRDKLEVIVGSDASSDGTDQIVRRWANEGVQLLRMEDRAGKTAVQNACSEKARGEILVFTDATTVLERESLRELVANFADPEVGCVGARLIYQNAGKSQVGKGGVEYWGYETQIKVWESRLNSLIGVSGCYYAVRADIYEPIPPNLISDFVVALDTVKKGYRVRFEPLALCYEETLADATEEIAMRIRVAIRTYCALWARRTLLNPFRYGFFSFQLLAHKVLRYLVAPLALVALLSNMLLIDSSLYLSFFVAQLAFYAAAAVGFFEYKTKGKLGLMSRPYYLIVVNYAAMVAFARFLQGQTVVIWTPQRCTRRRFSGRVTGERPSA
jgi:cellulose synthase/poly-beta-1,6-N-acetylglucosamine synthase-like glycosyltransferase